MRASRPQIRHLIEALSRVLEEESIDAPLMIVKGDGSLMKAEIALEYPVETILSGPAASVVGAGFLTGLADFVVADMGGTTTDIAVVTRRPAGDQRRRCLGRRMAHDGRSGRCAHQRPRRRQRGSIRPPASPLRRAAQGDAAQSVGAQHARRAARLQEIAELDRLPAYPTQFAFRNPDRDAAGAFIAARTAGLGGARPRAAAGVRDRAQRLGTRGAAPPRRCRACDRWPPSRRAMPCTCSTGSRDGAVEAAECGARILATEERNARAARVAVSPRAICERTYEHVVRETGRVLLAAALAHDPGLQAARARMGRTRGSSHRGYRRRTALLGARASGAGTCAAADRDRRTGRRLLSRDSRAPARRGAIDPRSTLQSAMPWAPSPASFRRPSRYW